MHRRATGHGRMTRGPISAEIRTTRPLRPVPGDGTPREKYISDGYT